MPGSKAPDFDAYGLLRATHSHNPTQYSHIVGLSSHFYALFNLRNLLYIIDGGAVKIYAQIYLQAPAE